MTNELRKYVWNLRKVLHSCNDAATLCKNGGIAAFNVVQLRVRALIIARESLCLSEIREYGQSKVVPARAVYAPADFLLIKRSRAHTRISRRGLIWENRGKIFAVTFKRSGAIYQFLFSRRGPSP